LTEDFQSDMNKPSIFIDLITDETISTNYMRMNTDLSIRENLENNVLGKFKAYGTRIEKVRYSIWILFDIFSITDYIDYFFRSIQFVFLFVC